MAPTPKHSSAKTPNAWLSNRIPRLSPSKPSPSSKAGNSHTSKKLRPTLIITTSFPAFQPNTALRPNFKKGGTSFGTAAMPSTTAIRSPSYPRDFSTTLSLYFRRNDNKRPSIRLRKTSLFSFRDPTKRYILFNESLSTLSSRCFSGTTNSSKSTKSCSTPGCPSNSGRCWSTISVLPSDGASEKSCRTTPMSTP